jgi:hypothetical protein
VIRDCQLRLLTSLERAWPALSSSSPERPALARWVRVR